ncbi:uncharacterized protein BDFB_008303, partial [Asbolus verrucosus]
VINELRGLSHGIRSGKIEIIDNNTFRVPNFYIDDKAPQAYFLAGKGDTVVENGTIVPIMGAPDGPLSKYDGQDVLLKLPDNLTVNDVDWLAIWCYEFHMIDELTGLSHAISSGKIEIIGNSTFRIPNFYIDDKAPKAYFLVGKGATVSEDGTPVPLVGGPDGPLGGYNGQDITLKLPDNLTVNDIDWLAIWCYEFHVNLGHVFLNKRVIDELTGLSHAVSSGKIEIIGQRTLHVPNFHIDGKAPRAYFLVGKGDKVLENGTLVPLIGAPDGPLGGYNGQDITLQLPDNLTVNEVDWLAIWCYAFHVDLGHVFLHKKPSPYPPQTFGLKSEVTSGPVVLVNKKTLFIPDLRYKGNHKNVHFWVGNGTEPTSAGLVVPDEEGSSGNLHPYQGENININLPNGVTTDNIEYFGVWSTEEKLSLGHVILKGIKDVPEVANLKGKILNNNFILRLPKCCPVYSIVTINGCQESPSREFKPNFSVYKHNATHFNNQSLDLNTIDFQPYNFPLECRSGKYPLDETNEESAILQNGSLLVKGAAISGILTQQHFCVDNIENEEKMKILVCVPEYKMQEAMFVAYVTLTVVSTFCFVGTFFLYCFWLKIEDIHRKCFTAYVLAMSVTFLSLTIVQIAHVEDGGCTVLAENQRSAYFYTPIIVSIVVSIVCLVLTKLKIVNNDRYRMNDYFWLEKGMTYKFMFRQCLLTLVIMTICWITDMLMSFLDESSGILNAAIIFEALQGVLIVAVFTMNHYGSSYLERHRIQEHRPDTLVQLKNLNEQNHSCE